MYLILCTLVIIQIKVKRQKSKQQKPLFHISAYISWLHLKIHRLKIKLIILFYALFKRLLIPSYDNILNCWFTAPRRNQRLENN